MQLFNHKTGRFTRPKTPMIAGGIISMEVAGFQSAGFMSGPNGLSLNQDL